MKCRIGASLQSERMDIGWCWIASSPARGLTNCAKCSSRAMSSGRWLSSANHGLRWSRNHQCGAKKSSHRASAVGRKRTCRRFTEIPLQGIRPVAKPGKTVCAVLFGVRIENRHWPCPRGARAGDARQKSDSARGQPRVGAWCDRSASSPKKSPENGYRNNRRRAAAEASRTTGLRSYVCKSLSRREIRSRHRPANARRPASFPIAFTRTAIGSCGSHAS